LSFSYWELLWRRAKRFMVRAERDLAEGDFDGACFNSEQALQLAIKAAIYRVFGIRMRIHSAKALLAQLRNMLYEAGRSDLADAIGDLVSSHRRELEILEESYRESRYGEVVYLESQGKACVDVAKKVLEVLNRIEVELAKKSS
jgi:HEPN domain-containing protein